MSTRISTLENIHSLKSFAKNGIFVCFWRVTETQSMPFLMPSLTLNDVSFCEISSHNFSQATSTKCPFFYCPLKSWRIRLRATSIMVHTWFTGTIEWISLIICLNPMWQWSDTKSWIWRNGPRRGTYSVLKRAELWTSRECNCILWSLNSRISSAMHTFWSQNGGLLMRWTWHPISLGQRRNVTKYIVSCRPDIFVTINTWMRYTVNDFMSE